MSTEAAISGHIFVHLTSHEPHRMSLVNAVAPQVVRSNQAGGSFCSPTLLYFISAGLVWRWLNSSLLSILSQASRWGGGRSSTSPRVEQGTVPTSWKQYPVKNPAALTGWWSNWRRVSLTMRRSADQGRRSHKFSASTAMVRIKHLSC